VDPYSLRANLSLPKLLINGTNDRYWTLDAANFYFDQLPGDKHLLYVPNAGHGLSDLTRVTGGLAAFFNETAAGKSLPGFQAHSSLTGNILTLSATSTGRPRSVVAWTASSATADFRMSHWTSTPMTLANGDYSFKTTMPTTGHLAIFAEAGYTEGGVDYNLSSSPIILPTIEHKTK
ncbi:MAG: PhoPQ-activated pathogenicity-related family protein, partial [Armatimonadota bacterium]|nr:PhoPQ-activated pathogenicity-related family protein [Armatimonadota bacterium]